MNNKAYKEQSIKIGRVLWLTALSFGPGRLFLLLFLLIVSANCHYSTLLNDKINHIYLASWYNGGRRMSPIPEFVDGYFLPEAEHECTFEEIEGRFLATPARQRVWSLFKHLYYRLETLGITPEKMLIDGSFVTGRAVPGDVDVCVYIQPEQLQQAYNNLTDEHDRWALAALFDQKNQLAMRNLFGAHLLIADSEDSLNAWSSFFRKGKNGILRDPDPSLDPEWVKRPSAKGILVVCPTR